MLAQFPLPDWKGRHQVVSIHKGHKQLALEYYIISHIIFALKKKCRIYSSLLLDYGGGEKGAGTPETRYKKPLGSQVYTLTFSAAPEQFFQAWGWARGHTGRIQGGKFTRTMPLQMVTTEASQVIYFELTNVLF